MNLEEAFSILKSNESMTISEIKKSYIDLVEVWHPDRFTHNDRLTEKAINEMKQINIAWESVKEFYKNNEKLNASKAEQKSNKNESFVLVKCANCEATNRIPTNISLELILKCGKCGKNPYLKFRG